MKKELEVWSFWYNEALLLKKMSLSLVEFQRFKRSGVIFTLEIFPIYLKTLIQHGETHFDD